MYSQPALPTNNELFLLNKTNYIKINTNVGVKNVFCITVYNENLKLVTSTLHSILLGLMQLEHFKDENNNCTYICIIIDGIENADTGLIKWLQKNELIPNMLEFQKKDFVAYKATKSIEQIFEYLSINNNKYFYLRDIFIEFIVCIKSKNMGKLHSHAIFLRDICPYLNPEYCYQIDAGTIIDKNALSELLKHIDKNNRIAALAPCILVSPPISTREILPVWQYIDFLMQKAVWWPFEVSAGHLSVLPGQFCVFRWKSLFCGGTKPYEETSTNSSPINAYLRGLQVGSPFERLMFLAEDRVIGNEIILATECRWTLDYAASACAITDICKNFSELLRQRRRWNNSTLACRLWLLMQWPHYLKRCDRSKREKISFSLAMTAQTLLVFFDLIAPATLVCTVAFMSSVLGTHGSAHSLHFIKSAFWIVLTATALLTCVNFRWPSKVAERSSRSLLVATAALLAGVFFVALSKECLFVIWAPILLSTIAILSHSGRNKWRDFQLFNIYLLTNFAITAILSIYSMWKIDDISWGTKGLRKYTSNRDFDRHMRRLKWIIWSSWIGLNGALIFIAQTVRGVTSPQLNIVIEIGCLGYAAIVVVALISKLLRNGKAFAWLSLQKLRARNTQLASGS